MPTVPLCDSVRCSWRFATSLACTRASTHRSLCHRCPRFASERQPSTCQASRGLAMWSILYAGTAPFVRDRASVGWWRPLRAIRQQKRGGLSRTHHFACRQQRPRRKLLQVCRYIHTCIWPYMCERCRYGMAKKGVTQVRFSLYHDSYSTFTGSLREYDGTFTLHMGQKDRTDPSVGRSRVPERGSTSGAMPPPTLMSDHCHRLVV